jgi:hypothetical protein
LYKNFNFNGKKGEMAISIARYWVRARRPGDLLFGKLEILKTDEEIKKEWESKNKHTIIDLYELGFTEICLSIDLGSGSRNV